ncbi:Blp family class II bacteriocin [Biformimicrobium ophioploci]|uniref:Bacteriocin n=1 Tax=Biformimicrobium ophioploci TaxID=3036711 RepID=A0ABQ6LUC3_9GAMM|nr:Blp family class II bacteriocin [Microbulbifer sp. NKW57]GMG85690.1 hypothetical protein MNKW57_00110 [Microbulbifer sp. NKW57]
MRELSEDDLSKVTGGEVDTKEIWSSALSYGGGVASLGASVGGAVAGPPGVLVGGLIGLGVGTLGGVYSYFA